MICEFLVRVQTHLDTLDKEFAEQRSIREGILYVAGNLE